MESTCSSPGSSIEVFHNLFFLFWVKFNQQVKTPSQSKFPHGGGDAGDDYENWMKSKQLLRPDDQLDLAEAELAEEIPKILTADDPNIRKNLVIYSFKEGGYVYVRL